MRVYRPVLDWDGSERTTVPTCTIVELEAEQRFTGLLDANGNRLVVVVKTGPIGFVVFPERNA
jgi:hypothetical protein